MNFAFTRRRFEAVLGAIATVTVAALVLLGIHFANGSFSDDYQITASTVRSGFGLDSTSDVKIRGVTVGSVSDVQVHDDGIVELTLSIREDVRVPRTSVGSIEPLSVFGPKFVDLDPGLDETTGPYLSDGDSLGAVLEPTELAETLNSVSELLDAVDPDDFGTLVTELARGFDGLGEELGETLDATLLTADLLNTKSAELSRIVQNSRLIASTLNERSGSLETLVTDARPMLRTIDESGDQIGSLLRETGRLSQLTEALVHDSAADLTPTLIGLGRAGEVLHDQLHLVPGFLRATHDTLRTLGGVMLRWDVGDGRVGGLFHAVVHLDACRVTVADGCPPEPTLDIPS